MRNISFSMTTEAFRRKEKTVTRRLGWWDLKPGDLLQGCAKCQGLKKGEKVERIHVIRVVGVTHEPLCGVRTHGFSEMYKEGFPDISPDRFIAMFCAHNHCDAFTTVNRILFEYVDA